MSTAVRRSCGWLLGLLGPALAWAQLPVYWEQHTSGWFWYVQPAYIVEPQPPGQPEAMVVLPEVKEHQQLQQRLEQTRSVAIMNPTQENVANYLTVQQEVLQRSAHFADVWQRVVWSTPELDYSVTHRPTHAAALQVWNQQRAARHNELVMNAAQTHGLFFVFGPECVYCAQMAAMLHRVSARFGFAVQAVSADGAVHQDFPDAWPDNGFVKAAQLSSLPAIMLARFTPGQQQLTLLASGPLADDELIERIAVLTGIPVGERF